MIAKKILILGAGIAGLAAAQELIKNNFNVTILEARNRIGGRICTDHSWGIPFDLGPAWLHGLEGNPIADLAHQLNLNMKFTDFSQLLFFDEQKNQISVEKVRTTFDQLQKLLKPAKEWAQKQKQDVDLLTAIKAIHSFNNETAEEQLLIHSILLRFELYYGADLNQLSAQHGDEGEVYSGGNYLLMDGYDSLLKIFENIPVQLNTVVSEIHYQHELRVKTNRGEFAADAVLVTFSLGVLKKQRQLFNPSLPLTKLEAIQKLDMGLLNRVALKFPERFWPNEFHGIYLTPNEITTPAYFFNYNAFGDQPILFAFSGGREGWNLENFSDEKIIFQMMNLLKKYFGNIPEPEKYLISRWGKDPFALGSYSYIPVGADANCFDAIAAPIQNRIFFAGEATHYRYSASVPGAYLSGLDQAKLILQCF